MVLSMVLLAVGHGVCVVAERGKEGGVTESLHISDSSRGFSEGVGGTGGSHFFSTFHTDINTHAHTRTHTHALTHPRTHTDAHTHTHTHTHTYRHAQTSHPLFFGNRPESWLD